MYRPKTKCVECGNICQSKNRICKKCRFMKIRKKICPKCKMINYGRLVAVCQTCGVPLMDRTEE